MNKAEAYKILSEELESLRRMGLDAAIVMLSESMEFERRGSSGINYCVTINIVETTLKGSIHDKNSYRFEILEEQIELGG